MGVYWEEIIDIELESGTLHRSFMNHAIGKGDNMGNRYGMRLFRNGEPVDLSNATCMGFFIDPHGTPILISGSSYTHVSGNEAYVQLPQACYNYEGQFTLSIKVIDPEVTETTRIIDGTIVNTGVDNAVAPTGSVPSYQEILALYDRMQAAIGTAKQTQGEGNANYVDGYHASELLVDIDGTKRQLQIRIGGADIADDVVTPFTFTQPFTNRCIAVSVMPQTGFNILSELSIVSTTETGVQIKQKNGQGTAMNIVYIAFGY